MAIRNNGFFNDDGSTRGLRLQFLQKHVDEFAAELDITGDLLNWAQSASDSWDSIFIGLRTDKAETSGVFHDCKDKQNELIAYYQRIKNILKNKAMEYENAREIIRAYGFDGATPQTRKGIGTVVDDLARQHEIYKNQGDPWILPDSYIATMIAMRDEMASLHTQAENRRQAVSEKIRLRNRMFELDTRRLRQIYEKACLVWGPDGDHFYQLGMLPKSAVWTAHRPPTPGEVEFDPASRILSWQGIEGVDSYEAEWRSSDSRKGDHWTSFYDGEADRCTVPADLHAADLRVRAVAGGKESHWSKVIQIAD